MLGKKRTNGKNNEETKTKKLKRNTILNRNTNENIKNEKIIATNIPKLDWKNNIKLTVQNKTRKFQTPEKNLELSKKMFDEFLEIENNKNIPDEKKFKKLSKILELCEVNPEYNFYYLLYFSKCVNNNNKMDFITDQNILQFTLTVEHFKILYKKEQSNKLNELFHLLKLCDDENNFKNECKNKD